MLIKLDDWQLQTEVEMRRNKRTDSVCVERASGAPLTLPTSFHGEGGQLNSVHHSAVHCAVCTLQ